MGRRVRRRQGVSSMCVLFSGGVPAGLMRRLAEAGVFPNRGCTQCPAECKQGSGSRRVWQRSHHHAQVRPGSMLQFMVVVVVGAQGHIRT